MLIDLGEDWSAAGDTQARSSRRSARGRLLAPFVVVVLLLAGGSVVPRPPFVPLLTIAIQGVTVTEMGGGGVFVGAQGVGPGIVARYALDSGGQAWLVAVPDTPDGLLYLAGPAVLVVHTYDMQGGPTGFTVLDAATGDQLWNSSGGTVLGPIAAGNDDALVTAPDAAGSMQVRYTSMRTGRAIWSRSVPALTQTVATDGQTGDATGWVLATPDGTVTLLARQTGAVLATRKIERLLPAGSTSFEPENGGFVTVLDGLLLVMRQLSGVRATLTSYGLPDLTPRWSQTGLTPGGPDNCGPVLCVQSFSESVVGLDPRTGSIRWRAQGWQTAQNLGGGRLLAFRAGTSQNTGVLDAGTGRLLGTLGDWTPLPGAGAKLVRTPDRSDYRSTWFGVLDADRALVQPLAKLPGLSSLGCYPYDDLLACRTLDARLQVWRYRR